MEGLSGSARAAFDGCAGCRNRPAGGLLRFQHGTDKTKTLARQGLDEALFVAGIADHAPGEFRRVVSAASDTTAPLPDGADEIILADDALPVADQVIEQVEDLGRDGDDVAPRCSSRRSVSNANSSKRYASCRSLGTTPITAGSLAPLELKE